MIIGWIEACNFQEKNNILEVGNTNQVKKSFKMVFTI